MRYPRNQKNIANARVLRRNMTPQERHLWYDFLRFCKPRFRRQELIGPYIADFFCYEAKLIIEVDGSQHFDKENIKKDAARSAYFQSIGVRVMRVDNGEVNRNFSGVCEDIIHKIKECGIETVLEIE